MVRTCSRLAEIIRRVAVLAFCGIHSSGIHSSTETLQGRLCHLGMCTRSARVMPTPCDPTRRMLHEPAVQFCSLSRRSRRTCELGCRQPTALPAPPSSHPSSGTATRRPKPHLAPCCHLSVRPMLRTLLPHPLHHDGTCMRHRHGRALTPMNTRLRCSSLRALRQWQHSCRHQQRRHRLRVWPFTV